MSDFDALRQLSRLIADDGFAMTFQSLGQYRGALLRQATDLMGQVPGFMSDSCKPSHDIPLREPSAGSCVE